MAGPETRRQAPPRRRVDREQRARDAARRMDAQWRAAGARADARMRAHPRRPADPGTGEARIGQRVRGWAATTRAERQAADAAARAAREAREAARPRTTLFPPALDKAVREYVALELREAGLRNLRHISGKESKVQLHLFNYAQWIGHTGSLNTEHLRRQYSKTRGERIAKGGELDAKHGIDVHETRPHRLLGISDKRFSQALTIPGADRLAERVTTGRWPEERRRENAEERVKTVGDAVRATVRGTIKASDTVDRVMPTVGGTGPEAARQRQDEYDRVARRDEQTALDRAREAISGGRELTDQDYRDLEAEREHRRSEQERIPRDPSVDRDGYDATVRAQQEREAQRHGHPPEPQRRDPHDPIEVEPDRDAEKDRRQETGQREQTDKREPTADRREPVPPPEPVVSHREEADQEPARDDRDSRSEPEPQRDEPSGPPEPDVEKK